MATRKAKKGAKSKLAATDSELEHTRGFFGEVEPIVRIAKTYTLIAMALVGWSLFWFVILRLLFLQGRFPEFALGAGLLILPFVGFLGWKWWSLRHPEDSRR